MARVLIIEDHPDNLELMSYLLSTFGHCVLAEKDGAAGLKAVRREHPDLIICDIHLPVMDGYEVARQLKSDADLSIIPLVAVTALAMVGDRDKGLKAGFDGYIDKPIDPEQFLGQVESFLQPGQRGVLPSYQEVREQKESECLEPKRATVLLVDDSPTNRALIHDTLAPSGYEVRLAKNVEEGLSLAKAFKPDLILSDLHMPDEDGFNFIRSIKADPQLADIPFVFISSSVWGESERVLASQLGAVCFLLRPIEPQTLLDELSNCHARGGVYRRQ
jgi:two-component system cell cycle response regulator